MPAVHPLPVSPGPRPVDPPRCRPRPRLTVVTRTHGFHIAVHRVCTIAGRRPPGAGTPVLEDDVGAGQSPVVASDGKTATSVGPTGRRRHRAARPDAERRRR